MDDTIIDASGGTLQQYKQRHTPNVAVRRYLWYRLARPILVASVWIATAAYIYWCTTTLESVQLVLDQVVPEAITATTMVLLQTVWVLGRHIGTHNADSTEDMPMASGLAAELVKDLAPPIGSRRLVAYHDEHGAISRVAHLQSELA